MDHYYIYCLHNEDLPEYYIGSTKNLTNRWYGHRGDSKRHPNYKVYKYINNNCGINNFKMEVLDEIYGDKQDARKLERYYIDLLCATLNEREPGRTQKEYDAWQKPIYRENNKEQISEKRKEKFTCICGSETRIGDQSRHFRSRKHINFISSIL